MGCERRCSYASFDDRAVDTTVAFRDGGDVGCPLCAWWLCKVTVEVETGTSLVESEVFCNAIFSRLVLFGFVDNRVPGGRPDNATVEPCHVEQILCDRARGMYLGFLVHHGIVSWRFILIID